MYTVYQGLRKSKAVLTSNPKLPLLAAVLSAASPGLEKTNAFGIGIMGPVRSSLRMLIVDYWIVNPQIASELFFEAAPTRGFLPGIGVGIDPAVGI